MKHFLLYLSFFLGFYSVAQVTVGPINDQVVCDDMSNDGSESFVLTDFNAQALGNQDPNTHIVSYYQTQFDAVNDVNALSSPYTNITNPETIFVRVEETTTNTFNVGTVNLFIEAVPALTNPGTYTFCGTPSAAGGNNLAIDVTEIESTLTTQAGMTFSYYFSQSDAFNGTNPLMTTIVGQTNTPYDLFIRAQNSIGCFEVISVNIIISDCGFTPSVSDLEECEDANGTACFDLSQNTPGALGTFSPNTHNVTYHNSQADATNGTNALPITYCTSGPIETLFARLEETATGSMESVNAFTITVLETPPTYTFAPLVGCDYTGSGFIEWYAASIYNQISAPSGATIDLEYYATQQDAQAQVNPLGFGITFNTDVAITQAFVRVSFNHNCASISPIQLTIDPNCLVVGYPDEMVSCPTNSSGEGCFDLTVNDTTVMATNNPALYQVDYFTNNADAHAFTNAIATPTNYCTTAQQSTVYARLSEIGGTVYTVVDFVLFVSDWEFGNTTIDAVTGCDDDLDGLVTLDLTAVTNQITSGNVLEYYETYNDAVSQTQPYTTPNSLVVAISAFNNDRFYVREIVTNGCDVIHVVDLNVFSNCNNSYLCDNAISLCERLGDPFVNIADGSNAEVGNYYPFSQSQGPRNPSWFYIPIETSGFIELEVHQNATPDFMGQDLDIDFVIYGPFTSPTGGCATGITQANYVSHSFSLNMPEIATIPNAQAGEFYLILTSNFSNQPGYLKVELGPNSTGAINCDGIRMQSMMDVNANGVVDAADIPFPLGAFNYEKNANGTIMNVVAPTGNYSIYDTDATAVYDLGYELLPAYASSYTVAPATYTGVSIPAGSGINVKDFLVTPVATYEDVAIYIIPNEQPRPGFTYTETVMFTNLGTNTVPMGQLAYTYDPLLSIVGVSDPNATISPTSIDLNYTNLLPFEVRSFDVEMQIPVIPTVALGDLLTNSATITPDANDITLNNNTAVSTQIIIGSYDPNDKMEVHGPEIVPAEFTSDDYLYYRIRFENTGTASAINVRVEDTLDPLLDWETIEMLDSSHSYVMTRMEDQVIWNFDNIMLPDSTTDPVGANGHIFFRIKPTQFSEGTVIQNRAEIYFDFNPPIITNTFTTTFATPLSVDDVAPVALNVSPNPASTSVTVALDGLDFVRDNTLTIYDLQGRVMLSRKLSPTDNNISISEYPSGVYLFELKMNDSVYTTKVVKE